MHTLTTCAHIDLGTSLQSSQKTIGGSCELPNYYVLECMNVCNCKIYIIIFPAHYCNAMKLQYDFKSYMYVHCIFHTYSCACNS